MENILNTKSLQLSLDSDSIIINYRDDNDNGAHVRLPIGKLIMAITKLTEPEPEGTIPSDIRTMISQLDGLAGNIIEYFEDNQLQYEEDDRSLCDFHESLNDIQNAITTFQEAQNWI